MKIGEGIPVSDAQIVHHYMGHDRCGGLVLAHRRIGRGCPAHTQVHVVQHPWAQTLGLPVPIDLPCCSYSAVCTPLQVRIYKGMCVIRWQDIRI